MTKNVPSFTLSAWAAVFYCVLLLGLGLPVPTWSLQIRIIDIWGNPLPSVQAELDQVPTPPSNDNGVIEFTTSPLLPHATRFLQRDAAHIEEFDLLGRHMAHGPRIPFFPFGNTPAALRKGAVSSSQLILHKNGFAPETLAIASTANVDPVVLRPQPELSSTPYSAAVWTAPIPSSGTIAPWQSSAWSSGSTFASTWDDARARNVLHLRSTSANHAYFHQTVCGLEARRAYLLRGWVKGQNIVNTNGGSFGATIGAWNNVGDHRFSLTEASRGSFSWKQDTATVLVGGDGCIDMHLSLGYHSNLTTGEAWFDDLQLEGPLRAIAAPGFVIHLEPGQSALIDSTQTYRWAEQLGKMVAVYVRLAGPSNNIRNGDFPALAPTHTFPTGLVSGNPFQYGYRSLNDVLAQRVAPWNDLTFGAIHEMGHNFALYSWGFAGEMQANLLAALVLDSLPHSLLYQEGWGGQYYVGWGNLDFAPTALDTNQNALLANTGPDLSKNAPVALIHLFKGYHDLYRNGGALCWDAIQYKFMLMVLDPRIGWDTFQTALLALRSQSAAPQLTKRFDDFLTALHAASPQAWSNCEFFTAAELNWIQTQLVP